MCTKPKWKNEVQFSNQNCGKEGLEAGWSYPWQIPSSKLVEYVIVSLITSWGCFNLE